MSLKLNIINTVKLPGMQVLHALMLCQQTLLFQVGWAGIFLSAASLRKVLNIIICIVFIQKAALKKGLCSVVGVGEMPL